MHQFHSPYGVYGHTPAEPFELTPDAKRVRRFLEDYFIVHGFGPDFPEIMTTLQMSQNETWEAIHQLEQAVQVMLVPGTENLVKMPPFSYVPTPHRVSLGDSRRWYTGCAGEACAINKMFPGRQVTIESTCRDCWEPITLVMKDGELLSVDPPEAVIHLGVHPSKFGEDWIVTCDSINFFRSAEHVAAWEEAVPQRRGVMMPIEMGPAWVDGVASTRYWNYDRGSDAVDGGALLARFRAMGLDVKAWE